MLADSDKAKSYIGQDVILATAPSAERLGRVVIVVGHLYDYAYLGDIPFGTGYVTGFAQFEVSLGADEYQLSENSWAFPTQQKLDEWAAGLPAHRVFIPQSLPSEALGGVVKVI